MTMREIRAVLSRGGKVGFAGVDGVLEIALRTDGVHIVFISFDDDEEPQEYAGDFAHLFELVRKANAAGVEVFEIAKNIH